MGMPLTRRAAALGAVLGLAGLAAARGTNAQAKACDLGWVQPLSDDLNAMADMLTKRLQPWTGPDVEALPEDFGFHGEGLATTAIQAAIDHLAQSGGGTVRLAQGDYVSGTLDLRSSIRFEVAKGARLLGSLDLKDYPERVAKRPTVMDSNMGMNQSLIFAEGCTDISICGEGEIDGRGAKANFPGDETSGQTPGRPFVIRVIDCTRVHINGISLKDSPCWMQNYLNCEDLLIENIHVDNQANFNNDGVDIDGCRRVIVRNCFISSEDDALCFKGASQRPMEQVLVENCRLYSSCNGLKFGTDSQGDFRNVLVRNVETGGPGPEMRSLNRRLADSGISWECVDGGTVENILATRIHIVRTKSPLFLRLGDRGRVRPEEARPAPGNLRRIVYDHVTGSDNGVRGSYFMGLPDKAIEDVVLRDVDICMTGSDLSVPDENAIPEMRGDYPDALMIKDRTPAYGLWARHVKGLNMERVIFEPSSADSRPMIRTAPDVVGVCSA